MNVRTLIVFAMCCVLGIAAAAFHALKWRKVQDLTHGGAIYARDILGGIELSIESPVKECRVFVGGDISPATFPNQVIYAVAFWDEDWSTDIDFLLSHMASGQLAAKSPVAVCVVEHFDAKITSAVGLPLKGYRNSFPVLIIPVPGRQPKVIQGRQAIRNYFERGQ